MAKPINIAEPRGRSGRRECREQAGADHRSQELESLAAALLIATT